MWLSVACYDSMNSVMGQSLWYGNISISDAEQPVNNPMRLYRDNTRQSRRPIQDKWLVYYSHLP